MNLSSWGLRTRLHTLDLSCSGRAAEAWEQFISLGILLHEPEAPAPLGTLLETDCEGPS